MAKKKKEFQCPNTLCHYKVTKKEKEGGNMYCPKCGRFKLSEFKESSN